MLQDIGLTVARQIPKDVLLGLLSGAHTLHGGVVRDMGGRIVAHLVQPTSAATALSAVPGLGWVANAFQTYQLHQIGLSLGQVQSQLGTVLKLATATTALSGLGVVVGIASHVALRSQIKAVGDAVQRIEAQTKRTNQFLDASHYGDLQAALDNLRHAREATSPATAMDWRQAAKTQFARIFHRAQTMWPKAESLGDAVALEESAAVAMTGHALAMSELHEYAMAASDFASQRSQWRELARRWCERRVLRDDPHRLLAPELRAAMPARELVKLLDFVHANADNGVRGVDWIDELRDRQAKASRLKLPSFADETPSLNFAQRLVARDAVLGASEAHLAMLAQKGISVAAFEEDVHQAVKQAISADGAAAPIWLVNLPISLGAT